MSDTNAEVADALAAVDNYRAGESGEVGAALAVVGLCAERVARIVDHH